MHNIDLQKTLSAVVLFIIGVNWCLIKHVTCRPSIVWLGLCIESMPVTVMRGDPTDVLETVALIPTLYCQVIVGAGLPVAMHVRFAAMPSVTDVEFCIESASFRRIGPVNLAEYSQQKGRFSTDNYD